MAIPKTIFQTFKTSKLPLLARWHIYRLKKKNPDYAYRFYDDQMIDAFMLEEFGKDIFDLYKRITIGAAKADVFRYAVLFKFGGVYLDIDSLINEKLSNFILPEDHAVISLESNDLNYVQYALFFEAGHPFLKKTLDLVFRNLRENRHPSSVLQMTGPAVFTEAIRASLSEDSTIPYRQLGYDYDKKVTFSFRGSKTVLYGFSRKNHWKKQEKQMSMMNDQ
jgi:inositol phosphorylceramide mannosyltransferase catalytic subunit